MCICQPLFWGQAAAFFPAPRPLGLPACRCRHPGFPDLRAGLQVEDDETPEMIMAKFMELDRIEKSAQEDKAAAAAAAGGDAQGSGGGDAPGAGDAPGNDGVLDEKHLLEVFKQTSMFNVKTALQDNALLLDADDLERWAQPRLAGWPARHCV